MSHTYNRFRRSIVIALTAVTLAGAIAGVQAANQGKAYAAACDKVNIVYCGLEGSDDATYAKSLQAFYAKNSDNGHNDLQAVYNWSGASASDMANLSTANTKVGTLYRDGDIKVDGKVVATDAWVSARFTEGDGFVQIKDGVWARKTTTSFANDSVKALVHYDANNQVDFAVMVDCGNAVKVTPVKVTPPTPPKAVLACTLLTATQVPGDTQSYKFVATATASNTTIKSYVFTFSDGTTMTVASNTTSAELVHKFADQGKTYTASVAVNSNDTANVTAPACATTVTTPKPSECKPGVPTGSADCTETVTPAAPVEEAPTELVNSGPGAIAGLFAGTSAFGAIGHRFISNRRRRVE